MTQSSLSQEDYETFRNYLEAETGIVLGDNKHYLVTSRLNRLFREFSYESLGVMLEEFKRNKNVQLKEQIIDAMTTNETMWFRDGYPFEILKSRLLPIFSKNRSDPLRIWSAASSSGQESFSISMMISEYQLSKPGALARETEIVGTDISPSMLRLAKVAQYDEMSLARGISEERRRRFFKHNGDYWEVIPDVRKRVRFAELNLLSPYILLGKFDLIFCRNVLIYFSADLKSDILKRMAQTLNPGGFLFLGGSESPSGYCDVFEMLRLPEGVIYRLK